MKLNVVFPSSSTADSKKKEKENQQDFLNHTWVLLSLNPAPYPQGTRGPAPFGPVGDDGFYKNVQKWTLNNFFGPHLSKLMWRQRPGLSLN